MKLSEDLSKNIEFKHTGWKNDNTSRYEKREGAGII